MTRVEMNQHDQIESIQREPQLRFAWYPAQDDDD
jgi:hypothetical protein